VNNWTDSVNNCPLQVIIAMLHDSGGLRGNHPVMLAKAEKVERFEMNQPSHMEPVYLDQK
jgi:hypothetical protein